IYNKKICTLARCNPLCHKEFHDFLFQLGDKVGIIPCQTPYSKKIAKKLLASPKNKKSHFQSGYLPKSWLAKKENKTPKKTWTIYELPKELGPSLAIKF
ncbi:hypothetical protein, partial [Streptococcus danieliae]|uniref:hypothetical protein n=1 Tax=Streptococcus danieliae TaxID=747656 RepID=UPI0026ED7CFF